MYLTKHDQKANLMAIAHLLNDFLVAYSVEVMQLLHSIGCLDAYKYNLLSTEFIINR